jgi:hypothetical protein
MALATETTTSVVIFRHFGKFVACNSFDEIIFILLYDIFFTLGDS